MNDCSDCKMFELCNDYVLGFLGNKDFESHVIVELKEYCDQHCLRVMPNAQ